MVKCVDIDTLNLSKKKEKVLMQEYGFTFCFQSVAMTSIFRENLLVIFCIRYLIEIL